MVHHRIAPRRMRQLNIGPVAERNSAEVTRKLLGFLIMFRGT
jgi:hypothetical protein